MGDRILLSTKDLSPHAVVTIYPLGNRDLISEGTLYLQITTFSGDFTVAHKLFPRISVIDTAEHYHKHGFGDC